MIRLFILGMSVPNYIAKADIGSVIIFGSWLTAVYKYKGVIYIVSLIPCKAIVCIANAGNVEFQNTATICAYQTIKHWFAHRLFRSK